MKSSIIFRFADKTANEDKPHDHYKLKTHMALIEPRTNEVLTVFSKNYTTSGETDYRTVLMSDVKKSFLGEVLSIIDGDYGFIYQKSDKKLYWSPLPIKLIPLFIEYYESFKNEIEKPSDIFRLLSL